MIKKVLKKINDKLEYWALLEQWENEAKEELKEIGLNPNQWFIDESGDIYHIHDDLMIEKAVTPFEKWLRNKCKN